MVAPIPLTVAVSEDFLERFFSAKTKPRACQSLNRWLGQGFGQPKQSRENAAAALSGFFNLCLALLKIGSLSLAGRFFRSVDLSACQKELVSATDLFLFGT
jgi:hypothetical protein